MTMPRSARIAVAVLGWALLYSRHGNDWRVVAQFEFQEHCNRMLDSRVDEETRSSIGGALEAQAPDNPLRVQAYDRAVRHVRDRFRCAPTS
jgi:hypothetical protein